jgi:hypothetical protein
MIHRDPFSDGVAELSVAKNGSHPFRVQVERHKKLFYLKAAFNSTGFLNLPKSLSPLGVKRGGK